VKEMALRFTFALPFVFYSDSFGEIVFMYLYPHLWNHGNSS